MAQSSAPVTNPYAPSFAAAPHTIVPEHYPVDFTGKAGEYFRIWIVNLALTILTLGIYSAWAKVRKKRYFYGHTWVDRDNFEYRGQPIAILKGRLVAVGLLAVYSVAGYLSALLKVGLLIVLLLAVPWLVVRSAAFNAHNSAYRNVRLHFNGRYAEALKVIAGYGLLTAVTLGLLYPLFKARLTSFTAAHHFYGTTQFGIAPLTGPFYGIFFRAIGLLILGGIVVGVTMAGATAAAAMNANMRTLAPLAMALSIFVIYALYLFIYAYVRARTLNLIWNAISIGPVRFTCALRARDLAWIYVSNILALLATLGLATPWAVIRTMRYRASKMTVIAIGSLEHFAVAESKHVSAAGEAVGEVFDIDFGL